MTYKTYGLMVLLLIGFLRAPAIGAQTAEAGTEPGVSAQEHAEESHAEEHDEGVIPDVIERWFNFLVLFGGLGFLLRKPASEFFESRRSAIQGGLRRARTAQRDAEVRMKDVNERLGRLETEVQRIENDADTSARAERDRIVADAKGEVDRAIGQSRAEVERLARSLDLEIRTHVADQVIARAQEQLRSRMTPLDRERALRKAVEQLQ